MGTLSSLRAAVLRSQLLRFALVGCVGFVTDAGLTLLLHSQAGLGEALAQGRFEFDLAPHGALGDDGDLGFQPNKIGKLVNAFLADHGGVHVGEEKSLAAVSCGLHDDVERTTRDGGPDHFRQLALVIFAGRGKGDVGGDARIPVRSIDRWFDTSQFRVAPNYTFGNIGRVLPDVRGPGTFNWDLSFIKNTRVHERVNLQFRAEAFNILNKPQFNNPGESGALAANGVDDDRDGFIDNVFGLNAQKNNGDPLDEHGHGTFCAGIIDMEAPVPPEMPATLP